MARNIRPLSPKDLPELSRFLSTGFRSRPDADFFHPEVLRWKYLKPEGFGSKAQKNDEAATGASPHEQPKSAGHSGPPPLSFVALNDAKQIVGHLGLCRTHFRGKGIAVPSGRVGTMHIIDWLGSPEQHTSGSA